MTESVNFFLREDYSSTNRTMFTFGKTSCCTCRGHSFIDYFGMTESVNFAICISISTTRTSVCSVTIFDTSRCCYNFNILMSKSSTKNITTFCAVTSLGTVCTSGQAMTSRRNYLLCDCYSTTNRTVLTFSKTSCSTSCLYCFISYFGMGGSRNNLLRNYYSTTN